MKKSCQEYVLLWVSHIQGKVSINMDYLSSTDKYFPNFYYTKRETQTSEIATNI